MATATTRSRSRKRRTTVRDVVELWVELFDRHELLTYASAIARQMLLAAVALVLLALGVIGAIGRRDLWNDRVAPQVEHHVLPQVFAGVNESVQQIFRHNSAGLIVFAAILAILEVSGSVRACMGALNKVYEADDERPWWIRFPISIALAAALVASLLGAVLIVTTVPAPQGWLWVPADIVRWICAVCLVGFAFGLLVRFAPAEPRAKRWASVGTGLVVVGWIVQSLLFAFYVGSVANFKTAAGSLLVFLVVITYCYVAAIVLLVGIEVDELLREDAGQAERTLHELARSMF